MPPFVNESFFTRFLCETFHDCVFLGGESKQGCLLNVDHRYSEHANILSDTHYLSRDSCSLRLTCINASIAKLHALSNADLLGPTI